MFITGRKGATIQRQIAAAEESMRAASYPMPGIELLVSPPSRTWHELFRRLETPALQGPIIVVLDEFPWMIDSDSALEGELQSVWDRVLERLPVLFILVGSDVAMMERLSEHDRPLFGRMRQMVINPFSIAEIATAATHLDSAEVIEAALITGGFPRLVQDLVDGGSTVDSFVRASLSDAYSPLVTTAQLTLAAEFPAALEAQRVLSEIGANDIGRTTFSDLVPDVEGAEAKRLETSTTRALRTLVEAKGIVDRETPAWASRGGRKRRYRIADPYLRFWFRYIDGRIDHIARGREDLVLARFERDWPTWRGYTVEPLVRDALTRLSVSDERLAGVEHVERWWRDAYRIRGESFPDVEVDLVGCGASETKIVGSIKWRMRGQIASQEVAELRAHRELVPRAKNANLLLVTPAGTAVSGVDAVFGATDLIQAYR